MAALRSTAPYEVWITNALIKAKAPMSEQDIREAVKSAHKKELTLSQIKSYLSMNSIFDSASTSPSVTWVLKGSTADKNHHDKQRSDAANNQDSMLYDVEHIPPPDVIAEDEYSGGTAVLGGESSDINSIRSAITSLQDKGVRKLRLLTNHRAGELASKLTGFPKLSFDTVSYPSIGLDYRRLLQNVHKKTLEGANCLCLVGRKTLTAEIVHVLHTAEFLEIPCFLQD